MKLQNFFTLGLYLFTASSPAWSGAPPQITKIGYVNPNAPAMRIPPYSGERYQDTSQESLDLPERSGVVINGIFVPADAAVDYEIYFYLRAFRNPQVLVHDSSDWCQPKEMENVPLMRIMCG